MNAFDEANFVGSRSFVMMIFPLKTSSGLAAQAAATHTNIPRRPAARRREVRFNMQPSRRWVGMNTVVGLEPRCGSFFDGLFVAGTVSGDVSRRRAQRVRAGQRRPW